MFQRKYKVWKMTLVVFTCWRVKTHANYAVFLLCTLSDNKTNWLMMRWWHGRWLILMSFEMQSGRTDKIPFLCSCFQISQIKAHVAHCCWIDLRLEYPLQEHCSILHPYVCHCKIQKKWLEIKILKQYLEVFIFWGIHNLLRITHKLVTAL